MGNVKKIIDGLEIFRRHLGDVLWVEADHDIIYAAASNEVKLSEQERQQLDALDWFIDTEVDCWAIFV